MLNYARKDEQLRYFSKRIISFIDLEEVVQVACCLFQVYVLTAKLFVFKLPRLQWIANHSN